MPPATISVLFTMPRSNYLKIPGLDLWDKERDARQWPQGRVCICHPPCAQWGHFKGLAKVNEQEKELALVAVEFVRNNGGILEHPSHSSLWKAAGLPLPGAGCDRYGGWTLSIDQFWFGHKCRKRTWLYIVGIGPGQVPAYPLRLDGITHVIGRHKRGKKEASKRERSSTPVEFARWLVSVARKISWFNNVCRMDLYNAQPFKKRPHK